MVIGGELASGVVSNALFDLLKSGMKVLQQRSDWQKPFFEELANRGAPLTTRERKRLLEWIAQRDLDRLVEASGDSRDGLVRLFAAELFDTASAKAAAKVADPKAWADNNAKKADRLAGAFWGALLAAMRSHELLEVRTAVAARHTEQLVQSLLDGLGWLGEPASELPRLLDPALPLERAWLRPLPGVALSPYQMLWARSALVPFDDRQDWLADLNAWANEPARISVAIVVGSGGMGKTRLALQLCRHLGSEGWLAGFYRHQGNAALNSLSSQRAPRLIVVDYADTQPDLVRRIIGRLVDRLPLRATRVRVLLLMRRSGDSGDPRRWLTGHADRVTQVIDDALVVRLSEDQQGLQTGASSGVNFGLDTRRRLYRSARKAFAEHFAQSNAAPTEPDLASPTYGSPLIVLMAALLDVDPDATLPREVTRAALLDRVLEREQRVHWVQAPIPQEPLQSRAVAIGTIFGASDEADAVNHLTLVSAWTEAKTTRAEVAFWLHDLYEGPRWINPIEPDLLGEFLVSRHLDEDLVEHTVNIAESSPQSAARSIELLARLVVSHPTTQQVVEHVFQGHLQALVRTATRNERPEDSLQVSVALTALVQHLSLEEAAVDVVFDRTLGPGSKRLALALTTQSIRELRDRIAREGGDLELQDWLAVCLNNVGVWRSELGQLAEAMVATWESVEIRRRLARTDATYLPKLARALNNLAASLWGDGMLQESLRPIEESVTIRRRLAKRDLNRYGPNLAGSLALWAECLDALDRPVEAAALIKEAIEVLSRTDRSNEPESEPNVYTPLSELSPAYTAHLASNLNHLAVKLGDLARRPGALAATEESVRVYRSLADTQPAYLPQLAGELATLARALHDSGDSERAVELMREAVGIRRTFAIADPSTYLPGLGTLLHALAAVLDETGQPEEALSIVRQAVGIFRNLAVANPSAYRSDLGLSLRVLGELQAKHSMLTDAAKSSESAVMVYRHAGDEALTQLAEELVHHAALLSSLGRREDGLAAAREAAGLRRKLARSDSTHLPELARVLHNISYRLTELGRPEEDAKVIGETVDLYRLLFEDQPDRYLDRIVEALNDLGHCLGQVNRLEESVIAIREAISIANQYVSAGSRNLKLLIEPLNNLGLRMKALGRPKEAIDAMTEAVKVAREHATATGTGKATLAMSLTNLASLTFRTDAECGLSQLEEAIALYREVDAQDDSGQADLVATLANYGIALTQSTRIEEAVAVLQESMERSRPIADANPGMYLELLVSAGQNLAIALKAAGEGQQAEAISGEVDTMIASYPWVRRRFPLVT